MGVTLEGLAVLEAIERCGSFAAAAEELCRVPSALTYAVQKLEQDLGVMLFDRAGHRARLTSAGQELLAEGRHLLRAAQELETRVRRVATGWESELRLTYDDLLPLTPILGAVGEFYRALGAERGSTRIRLTCEVLGGCWDALVSGRADIAIGAAGDSPARGGFVARPLAVPELVFAVAREHPLARAAEPVSASQLLRHRAVAIADSSRNLPARTVGLLSGQDVFTVPSGEAKLAAQIAGLGVGFLARHLAAPALADGRLVEKRVAVNPPATPMYLAWRSDRPGNALRWFVKRLAEPDFAASLFGSTAAPERGTRRRAAKRVEAT